LMKTKPPLAQAGGGFFVGANDRTMVIRGDNSR